jgi:hypothetical protein
MYREQGDIQGDSERSGIEDPVRFGRKTGRSYMKKSEKTQRDRKLRSN